VSVVDDDVDDVDDDAVVRSTSLDSSSHATRLDATRVNAVGVQRARASRRFSVLTSHPHAAHVASIFQFQGDVESRVTSTPTRDE